MERAYSNTTVNNVLGRLTREKNEEFLECVELVKAIMRRRKTLPTLRNLDKDPDINMKRMAEICGGKNMAYECLIRQARFSLEHDENTVVGFGELYETNSKGIKHSIERGGVRMKETKEQVAKVEQLKEQPVEQSVEQPVEQPKAPVQAEAEQPKAPVQAEAEQPKQKRTYNARKWTFEEVKNLIRKYYETTGKLPTDEYLKIADNMPSPMTARKYLGDRKEEWLKAIGIEQAETTAETGTVQRVEALNEYTENGRIIDEIVELIGEAGKIAKIAENVDILESVSIAKKYQIDYNGIRICVDISARKLGQQNA